uniref:B box-type domain-containing protein n=1 Tax=Chromera velia CCMP2878 TaxID=1169474 RepID=A0A0G4FGV3_9ALVE|eukprot:Cvel_16929.t1-p1 / transcript=Cvel_16929.t1 / gene=Cvel_16929 / organism=Chromera_velia_CCMP2878 / gene_product=hypothetical protein / transcript_product=hypothetical protein / location=Cvel_scaffold1327:13849-21018(+) / protein_length=583 / sequence_SO=supercontig / SO=protein_coding / is_pseudo=false
MSVSYNVVALSRLSEEWGMVEYFLQLCIRSSCARLKNAWSISVPEVSSLFERRNRGSLVLHSWVDTGALTSDNTIQDVCRRGFRVPQSGLRVSVGNLGLPGLTSRTTDPVDPQAVACRARYTAGRRMYEFILCKAGVGKSVVAADEDELKSPSFSMPEDYDSVYIRRGGPGGAGCAAGQQQQSSSSSSAPRPSGQGGEKGGEGLGVPNSREPLMMFDDLAALVGASMMGGPEGGQRGVLPQHVYRHDFVLFDSAQLSPEYLVQFEFDPERPEGLLAPLCDACEEQVATLFCAADAARLCDDCDELLHSQNKLTQRHVRVPVNEMTRKAEMCESHPNVPADFWCPSCHEALCQKCLDVGSHSQGQSALHITKLAHQGRAVPAKHDPVAARLLHSSALPPLPEPVVRVLRDAPQRLFDVFELVEHRRRWIAQTVAAVEDRMREVACNSLQVEDRVFALLEEALHQLQEETEKKMVVLLGDQIEVRRQMDFIDWSEGWLRHLRDTLPPADFLYAWTAHCKVREENSAMSPGDFDLQVPADMKLEGRVEILSDAAMREKIRLQRQRMVEQQQRHVAEEAQRPDGPLG